MTGKNRPDEMLSVGGRFPWRTADGVETLIPPEYATHEEYEAALRDELAQANAQVMRLSPMP
jgi:hypothetical protein